MKKVLLQLLIRVFVIEFNFYLLWSRFYRLFQRKRERIPNMTLKFLEESFGNARWEADSWYMLWDVISHPEAAWHKRVNHGSPGDCDDWSAIAAEVLQRKLGKENTKLLSVQWLDRKNKFHGHNVCFFNDSGATKWISNWYNGKSQAVEGDFESSPRKIVEKIIEGGNLVSFIIIDPHKMKIDGYGFK